MKEKKNSSNAISERGGAGVKLLLVVTFIALLANAGYNFIPVAYQGENFKQEMQTVVVSAVSLPIPNSKTSEVIKFRLKTLVKNNRLPYETYVDVVEKNNVIEARVYYVKSIPVMPFGIYDYNYVFDHTATPGDFLGS